MDVAFEGVDGHDYQGQYLVAFETMRKGEEVVAEHADISDDAQAVKVPTLMPSTGLPGVSAPWAAGLAALAAGCAGACLLLRRRA